MARRCRAPRRCLAAGHYAIKYRKTGCARRAPEALISGYLYSPARAAAGASDAGSTHAWAEIFLPGAGWITFDPTNRGVGGFNLIPVAVGRIINQVMPISGTFQGATDAFQGMSVEVRVTP